MDRKPPGCQRMLEDVRQGKFSHLTVSDVSRLSRDAVETCRTLQDLIGMGVKLVLADAPSLEFPPMPSGLRLSIQAAISQYDVEMLKHSVNYAKRTILLRAASLPGSQMTQAFP